MNKKTLIEKLLTEKAKNNNTIDLNAYALGLDAMYEALVLYDVVGRSEQLITFQNFLILDGQLDLEPDEVKRNAEIFLGD